MIIDTCYDFLKWFISIYKEFFIFSKFSNVFLEILERKNHLENKISS